MRQRADFRFHGPERPVGDERVDVPLVRSPFAFPLDMEAQEKHELEQWQKEGEMHVG